MVKIATGNQADSPEETYEPVCEFSSAAPPRANCSFLWSSHGTKTTFPNDKPDAACHASTEDNDSEGYDDVGPSNFVAQAVRIIVYALGIPLSSLGKKINLRFNVTLCEATCEHFVVTDFPRESLTIFPRKGIYSRRSN